MPADRELTDADVEEGMWLAVQEGLASPAEPWDEVNEAIAKEQLRSAMAKYQVDLYDGEPETVEATSFKTDKDFLVFTDIDGASVAAFAASKVEKVRQIEADGPRVPGIA